MYLRLERVSYQTWPIWWLGKPGKIAYEPKSVGSWDGYWWRSEGRIKTGQAPTNSDCSFGVTLLATKERGKNFGVFIVVATNQLCCNHLYAHVFLPSCFHGGGRTAAPTEYMTCMAPIAVAAPFDSYAIKCRPCTYSLYEETC